MANGISSSDWKKGNIVPVHKKNYKQRLNNMQQNSGAIDEMFGFFTENDLIAQHQPGFKPQDS